MNNNYSLLIIDGMSVLFRAFYAMQDMQNGAVYGFTRFFLQMIEAYLPKYVVVALDCKQKTWRSEMLPSYKSNRKETPLALIPQFEMMRRACEAFGIRYYEGEAAEADDWIASSVKTYSSQKILIASSDKDLLQLISENVHMYDLNKRIIMREDDVVQHWGVRPAQICDLLSLTGDTADCVCGIKGIGIKTASQWLQQYSTLNGVFENRSNLKPVSRQKLLTEGMKNAELAKILITLRDSLKVLDINELHVKPSICDMKEFFENNKISLGTKAEKVLQRYCG